MAKRLTSFFLMIAAVGVFPAAIADPARVFERFVDELPRLTRIQIAPGQTDLTITMSETQAKMHRDLPAVKLWTYQGSAPGPQIEVESGQALRVHWINNLPLKHIFPEPAGAMSDGAPDVRTVVHLHGAKVKQPSTADRKFNNDGWPDAWTKQGEEQITEYPNQQRARMLWYHDHAIGSTGRNVAAGLAGAYVIHDAHERSLNLPSGDYETTLFLQSHGINPDGSRFYTNSIAREFYGNSVSVNGKLWPYMDVEPRKYRFRIINAANARTFALKLVDFKNQAIAGPPIFQIGTDSGFLEETAILNDPSDPDSPRLTLSPAERADVIIDFSAYKGRVLLLHNNSLDPGDGEIPIPPVMQFRVKAEVAAADTSNLPMHPDSISHLKPEDAAKTRRIVFDMMKMPDGTPMLMLNSKAWHDPVTEFPVLGTTEVWELIDTLPDAHPFHMHLVDFQVLDRRPYDVEQFKKDGTLNYTGSAEAPQANELGWKDTVIVQPLMVTRIIMKFGPYKGHYVYHCHILEHEDMDMMRPFDVVDP